MTEALHPQKPLKTYTRRDWETYYEDPQNFSRLFADRLALLDQSERMGLSTSQAQRLEVINAMIDGHLAV